MLPFEFRSLSFSAGPVVLLTLSAVAEDCPMGWAAVNALGQNGTTDGGNGVMVQSITKPIINYVGSITPYTIIIDGTSMVPGPAWDSSQ